MDKFSHSVIFILPEVKSLLLLFFVFLFLKWFCPSATITIQQYSKIIMLSSGQNISLLKSVKSTVGIHETPIKKKMN